MSKVLVADDEPDTRDICSKILKKQGHQVFTARDGLETLKFLEGDTFDILLLDLRMPGKGGMEILDVTREMGIDTIVITAYASIETAVEAMKKGALDYLAKPFTAQELRLIVEKTLSRQRFLNTEKYLAWDEQDTFFEMVGSSPEMQGLYGTIERISHCWYQYTDRRGDRHRKGTCCQGYTPQEPPFQSSLYPCKLRGIAREPP